MKIKVGLDIGGSTTKIVGMKEGKIIADELITREVTLDTLVEDGFEYLIKHGPEQIKVLIKIGE